MVVPYYTKYNIQNRPTLVCKEKLKCWVEIIVLVAIFPPMTKPMKIITSIIIACRVKMFNLIKQKVFESKKVLFVERFYSKLIFCGILN